MPPAYAFKQEDERRLVSFARNYLMDIGFQAQLLEAMARELPPHGDDLPQTILRQALSDIAEHDILGGVSKLDIETLINGAMSYDLLVRWAHRTPERLIPAGIIPLDEQVDQLLAVFHESRTVVEPQPAA